MCGNALSLIAKIEERIGSDAGAPTASVGRGASNIPEATPEVAEVRLEEGDGANDIYPNKMLQERLMVLAMQKPRWYYDVARGRAPAFT